MLAETSSEAIITRYTDQPARMPLDMRRRIEDGWGGTAVQLYAVADLDGAMKLKQSWVALGPEHVSIASAGNGKIHTVSREEIREVREVHGLSCTQLLLLGEVGEPALASFRYTHRQRRAMENIKFVLQQGIHGHVIESDEADTVYSDAMAHAVREAQASVASSKLAVVWRLLAFVRPYKVRVTLGFVSALILTFVNLVPPYLTGYLIDEVFTPVRDGRADARAMQGIAFGIVGVIALAYIIRQFTAWVRMRTMSIMGEYVARDLRTQVYEHLQKLSLSFYSSKQTGSLISRVSSDTDRLWDFLAWGAVDFVLSLAMFMGLGGVMLFLDWRLGLIMVLPMPLLFWAMMSHGRRMHRIFLRCWRNWSGLTAILADTIPGVRVVKAFNQERRERHRFNDQNNLTTDGFNTIHATWTTFWPVLWLAIHVLMLGVWICAVPRVLDLGYFGPKLSEGTFVRFVIFMGMFVGPIEILGRMTFIINRASSSAHRVFEVLDTEPAVVSTKDAIQLEPIEGRVTFDNVSFAYDGVRQILQNISFDVKPGEMIGLVGPSGAGKSTITNLIARFYDVSGGRLLIDGHDLRKIDLGHYRRQLGIVLQDPYLFHGTVLDNIRYGVPEATLDEVVDAARAANAHDFICKLPHGYDTMVGERGHTLSGGERQRVSIARAILSNPRVLILDEATSSVDTETECKIQEALDHLVSGRTVFAIAHRLSTLRRASRLFVIEDGRISEQGTHAELLANPEGTYTKLVNMQQELHGLYAA